MSVIFKQALGFAAGVCLAGAAMADTYKIDTQGAHAFIQFKISHLGYSWLLGRFNQFDGTIQYDEAKPEASSVEVEINTASVDSNHAERDKHLRSDDFLAVDKFPKATFKSAKVMLKDDGKAEIIGTLTLRGVSKEIVIDAERIGGGADPWGGYRQGFMGTTHFALKDFGIPMDLGPASQNVEMFLSLEGIKQ